MARASSMTVVPREHRASSFWFRLGDAERRAFVDVGKARRYLRGATLISAEETGRWAAVLYSGRVRVVSADGTRFLATRQDGDIVGEQAVLDGKPRSATVRAETPVHALVLDKADLDRLLDRFPQVLRLLCAVLSDRLRECDGWLVGQDGDAFTKIVRHLARSVGKNSLIVHIGSQAALGETLGVCRESVVRALRRLREESIVTTDRGLVTVRDLERLRAYPTR